MNILNYVRSILPNLERNRVADEIASLIKIEENSLIGAWELVGKELKGKYKAESLAGMEKSLQDVVKGIQRGSLTEVLEKANVNAVEVLKFLEAAVNDTFGEVISRDGMDYRKAVVLQYVDQMREFITYQRGFIRFVTVTETQARFPSAETAESVFSPGELKEFATGWPTFRDQVVLALKSTEALRTAFDEIPEVAVDVNGNEQALGRVMGFHRIDPFNFRGFVQKWNPIFWVQLRWAAHQVDMYNAAVEDRKALEQRLLHLRELEKSNPNPQRQQVIAYHEQRLAKLNDKIKETERKYG